MVRVVRIFLGIYFGIIFEGGEGVCDGGVCGCWKRRGLRGRRVRLALGWRGFGRESKHVDRGETGLLELCG